ncbi:hypothetical protein LINGRAHAP2_LOCUS2235, partial [Linum grandiflorum]
STRPLDFSGDDGGHYTRRFGDKTSRPLQAVIIASLGSCDVQEAALVFRFEFLEALARLESFAGFWIRLAGNRRQEIDLAVPGRPKTSNPFLWPRIKQCHVEPKTSGFDRSAPASFYELQRSKWVISHSFDLQTTQRQNLWIRDDEWINLRFNSRMLSQN